MKPTLKVTHEAHVAKEEQTNWQNCRKIRKTLGCSKPVY